MQHCNSPFCIEVDGLRGRMFTPSGTGLESIWCAECIRTGKEMQFFSSKTANMIRQNYLAYADTNLPKPVALFLKQFVIEILKELNEEL